MSRISRRTFLHNAALSGALLSRQKLFALRAGQDTHSDSVNWDGLRLFFQQPAAAWQDALPVGNGRLGAMVFGNTDVERIQLNEESIWDGEYRDRDNPRAGAAVPIIRQLLFEGKVHEAEALAVSDMLSMPRRMPCYQTLGDLTLDFSPANSANASAATTSSLSGYKLELDLDRAIVTTRFTRNEVQFTREVFSSAPDQVIVIRLAASQRGDLSFHPVSIALAGRLQSLLPRQASSTQPGTSVSNSFLENESYCTYPAQFV